MDTGQALKVPVQARSQQSTARMLDGALAILDRGGVTALTIAAVGEAAGVSTGAIYHRFRDRDALLVAAQERFLSRIEEQWPLDAENARTLSDDREFVHYVIDTFDRSFTGHRNTFRAFMVTGNANAHIRRNGTESNRRFAVLLRDVLLERFGCAPDQAHSAYRIMYSGVVLDAMFTGDEVSERPLSDTTRIEHLTTAVLAVLTTG